MKATDIIGYVIDGATYCLNCTQLADEDAHGTPIFACDENANSYTCDDCFLHLTEDKND